MLYGEIKDLQNPSSLQDQIGKVEIPQDAFIGVPKISKEKWFFI